MTFTVRDIAERLRVDQHKVLSWIASGELTARNVAASTASRPSWRITSDDLTAFLDARASRPRPQPSRRRRLPAYREVL